MDSIISKNKKSIVNTTDKNMNKSKSGNWIKGVSRKWKALKTKAQKANVNLQIDWEDFRNSHSDTWKKIKPSLAQRVQQERKRVLTISKQKKPIQKKTHSFVKKRREIKKKVTTKNQKI